MMDKTKAGEAERRRDLEATTDGHPTGQKQPTATDAGGQPESAGDDDAAEPAATEPMNGKGGNKGKKK